MVDVRTAAGAVDVACIKRVAGRRLSAAFTDDHDSIQKTIGGGGQGTLW